MHNYSNIKGFLFDVDGTLYHQLPLRMIMVFLLVTLNIHKPKGLFRKMRMIAAYRKAQEILRISSTQRRNCFEEQITLAANLTSEAPEYISKTVEDWLGRRPLPFIKLCRRKELKQVLEHLHKEGFQLGVFSDYPALDKLRAMGIEDYFQAIVTPNDPDLRGFKPDTNGFAVAAIRMGLNPSEILYIGDRVEVDGRGASAAGMPVIIINSQYRRQRSWSTNGDSSRPSRWL